MKRLNGIRLPKKKRAEDKQITTIPMPRMIRIPMLMHPGAASDPTVSEGDHVNVGQLIGLAKDDAAVPVHSSVSGTVTAITTYQTISGEEVPCVEIKPDEEQLIDADCQPPKLETQDDLADAAWHSGCVGLGGDGYPTYLKFSTPEQIRLLVVNGAECETYLSSDGRQMVEAPEQIIGGIQLIMKLMKIKEARIGIQRTQAAAIRMLSDAAEGIKGIQICPLPPVYPQGAEKVLIFHTSGITVPEDKTPEELGILVLNVSTCAFMYHYSLTGIPLVERVVTVDGDAVTKPCNLRVPIGTPVSDLLDYAACETDKVKLLLCGGLMMGDVIGKDAVVIKPQNGLTAMKSAAKTAASACIRCGRCMNACPMHLMPMLLDCAYHERNVTELENLHIRLCMNCGCCTFECPAKRPLAETIQLAKTLLGRVDIK